MPVICISGQSTCGTSTTAKMLAERLGLKYFSPGQYYKKHFSGASETEKMVSGWRTKKGSSKDFHEKIDGLQQKAAEDGDVVIDGKLSIWAVKNAELKVWIKADTKIRAGRVMKRDGIEFEEALVKVREKDKLERDGWKKVYGFDFWEQEKKADLVIDNSDLTPEEVVDKIVEFFEAKV